MLKATRRMLDYFDQKGMRYHAEIDRTKSGKDIVTVFFEIEGGADKQQAEADMLHLFKAKIGLSVVPKAVPIGDLPRNEKKATRIYDNRY